MAASLIPYGVLVLLAVALAFIVGPVTLRRPAPEQQSESDNA